MKTVANHFVKQIWMVCFCFALAAISAHGQVGGGLIAYNITFNGNSVTCDSFDSSDANHSIWQTNLFYHGVNYGIWSNGLGYDPNSPPSRTANCHVATLNGLVDVGAARIYGYINTTPGGTYTIKNQGSVGDLDWVHNGISGVQSGHFRDSVNQTFPSFPLPTTFSNAYQINKWLPVPSAGPGTNIIKIGGMWTNIAGTWTNKGGLFYTNKSGSGWAIPYTNGYVYKTVITNRPPDTNSPYIYYTMNSISSSNLFIDAPYVVLYVTNGMSSPILTLNTNADAIIYSGGDITFALGGAINNNSKLAGALTIDDIQGRPISINASGNAITYAKLYVPGSSIV